MKNNLTTPIVILFLILGALGIYAIVSRDTSMLDTPRVTETSTNGEKGMLKEATNSTGINQKTLQKEGKYLPFSPEVFTSSAGSRRVLFFYASWCPTCRPADANFSSNVSQIPGDVTLIRVNYNDTDTDQAEKDLANKYAVTYQHTFVQIDAEGKVVTKWNGGQIEELLTRLK